MFCYRACRYLVLLLPILAACRHRSEPNQPVELGPPQIVEPPKPEEAPKAFTPVKGEVLSLEGIRWTSLSAYDATERCTALEEFSKTFAQKYGDKATLKDWTCTKDLLVRSLTLVANFQIVSEEKQPKLRYWIDVNDSKVKLQFSVDSVSRGDADYSKELGAISPKLGHWESTLKEFVKNPNANLKVYGRPFGEFVAAVILDLNTQGLTMKAKDGTKHVVQVSLKPGENKASGTVFFKEVPAALFPEKPIEPVESTSGVVPIGPSQGVLGCSDPACLNDGSVGYLIVEEFISLWRDIPGASGSVKQTSFSVAKFLSFPEQPAP